MRGARGFIQVLKAELKASLPGYTVEAREPIEGELRADTGGKQVFITREGFEFPEGFANLGRLTTVRVPILVSCVMQRPKTEAQADAVFRRSESVAEACLRAVISYCIEGEGAGNTSAYVNVEQPSLIEGFYVSIHQIDVEYELFSTGEPT